MATGNFTSAMMDSNGGILAKRARPSERKSYPLVVDVPLGAGKATIYTRTGNWLAWVSLVGFVFFVFYPDVVKRRYKRAEEAAEEAG